MRIARGLFSLIGVAAALIGCAQLFGIEEGNLILEGADATSDAAPPAIDGSPPDVNDSAVPVDSGPPVPGWLFAACDPAGQTEVAIIASDDYGVKRITLPTGDAILSASGGRAFVLNRTSGDVFLLDRADPTDPQKVARFHTAALPDGGAEPSNPWAVAVVSPTKAYVVRYDSNRILVFDPTAVDDAGVIKSSGYVDLSGENVGGDTIVDMAAAAYDPVAKLLYVALERIARPSTSCPQGSEIVAIDTQSDTVTRHIQLAGGNPGQGGLLLDPAGGRLLVVDWGCSGGAAGIEQVPLDGGDASFLQTGSTPADTPSLLLYVDPTTAFVQTSDTKWHKWNPTQTALGAASTQIPQVPFIHTTGNIIGLRALSPDGGPRATWQVWNVDKQLGIEGQVLDNTFQSVSPSNPYLLSSALQK